MVLTGTHNLCFGQKYEKYQSILFENFQFLEVKFSIYLNRRVFVMKFKQVSIYKKIVDTNETVLLRDCLALPCFQFFCFCFVFFLLRSHI